MAAARNLRKSHFHVIKSTRLGAPGGPDVRQALECPPIPAYARRGHPVKAGAHAGHETGGAAIRNTLWHVRSRLQSSMSVCSSQH